MVKNTCLSLVLLLKRKSASIYFLLTIFFVLYSSLLWLSESNSLLANDKENVSPFIIRKPETLESLCKIADNEKSYHVFVYDKDSKTIIPLAQLKPNKNNLKYISFRTNNLKNIEIKLFEDGKNGVWDHFSLIDAALIAEGITDDSTRGVFLDKYDKICHDLKRRIVRYSDPKIKTRFVFEYMHRIVLKGKYNLNLSVISEVFNSGNYNCVSATVLFNSLAREVGLKVIGLETTGHAKSRVLYENEFLDIETTCPRWSLLPDKITDLSQRNVIPEPNETFLKIAPLAIKNSEENSKTKQIKNVSSEKSKKEIVKNSSDTSSDSTSLPAKKKMAPEKIVTKKTIASDNVTQKNTAKKRSSESSDQISAGKSDAEVKPAINVSLSSHSIKNFSEHETSKNNLPSLTKISEKNDQPNAKSIVAARPLTKNNSNKPSLDRSTPGVKRVELSDKSNEKSLTVSTGQNQDSSNENLVWSGNRVMREISYGQLIATIYYNNGVDYYQDQNCAMALSCYLKALQLDPNNETIWSNFKATLNNWAIQLAKSNKFPEAIRMVEIGIEIDPKFEQFQLNLPIFFLNWITKLEGEHRMKEAADLKKIFKMRFPNYNQDSLKDAKSPNLLSVKKNS